MTNIRYCRADAYIWYSEPEAKLRLGAGALDISFVQPACPSAFTGRMPRLIVALVIAELGPVDVPAVAVARQLLPAAGDVALIAMTRLSSRATRSSNRRHTRGSDFN
jgi:hypothetical protein